MALRVMTAALVCALLAPVGGATRAAPSKTMEARELRQEGARVLVAPDVPTNVDVIADFNTMSMSLPLLRVRWMPPAGGAPVLAYKVYVNDQLIDTTNAGSWMETKVTNLVVGTRYKFSVSAVNADGESAKVDFYQTAAVQPDPPRNVQAVPGDGWIDVSWDAPLDNGGAPIGSYSINGWIPALNQSNTQCTMTGPTSCRMPNVINNEVYDIMVFAISSVPSMLISDGSPQVYALATGLPSGPRRFRMVSGGTNTLTLAWDPPLEPGPEPILGYEISWTQYLHGTQNPPYYDPFVNPWKVVVPVTQLSHQITGLTPGYQYRFAIQAFTATNIGSMTVGPLYLAQENFYQPLGLPGKPTQVGILGMGSGAVKLKWEAPGSDGGAAIKMYRLTLTPVSGDIQTKREKKPIVVECTADGPDPQCESEYIVQGLKDGVQYSVAVAGKNRFGWGPSSVDPVIVTTEPTAGKPPAQVAKGGFNNRVKGTTRRLEVE